MVSVKTLRHRYQNGAQSVVRSKLQGTVWQRMALAQGVYAVCLALGRALGKAGFTPNSITYASFVIALGAGGTAAFGLYATGALLLGVSGLCDVLDGIVARTTNQVSRYGALLDSTLDRFADAFPLLGVLVAVGQGWWGAVPALAMLAGFAVSYVRARAEGLGASLPPLFMRRAERIVLLAVSLLAASLTERAGIVFPVLLVGVGVIAILNCVAVVVVLVAARKALSEPAAQVSGGAESAG